MSIVQARLAGLVPSREAEPMTEQLKACRPEVDAFALLMERELQANDHKPGWKGDSPLDLVERVEQEAGELRRAVNELERQVVWADEAIGRGNGWSRINRGTGKRQVGVDYAPMEGEERETHLAKVISECADVANMAMMVADVCGGLTLTRPSPEADALRVENDRLRAENERLSKAVCSGVLGDLLAPDENEALVNFVKELRQAALARTPAQEGE